METSRRTRVRRLVQAAITFFVVVLLTVVTLGLIWTGTHQPPAMRTASQVVLGISAFAGIFALARIWRPEAPRGPSGS
jgi:membrane protein YdbS with pleckstrin-like domain